MTPDEVETTKLLANSFDRASTACFTVGIATPLAGYVYNVSGFRGTIGAWELLGGLSGWLIAAIFYIVSRDGFSEGCGHEHLLVSRLYGDPRHCRCSRLHPLLCRRAQLPQAARAHAC